MALTEQDDLTPRRASDAATLAATLGLMRRAFAGMDGVVDPPSSIHRLTLADLERAEEVWVIGDPPVAAAIFSCRTDALYLGKLAVDARHRYRGLARRLIDHAARRALALGRPCLELQTRIELTGNHAAFARLGFRTTGTTAHPGYDRPTSVTMRKEI